MPLRSALYVDGFNMYHAIDDLKEPLLKWISYWKIGEIIIPSKSESLVKVAYCTAFYPGDSQKRWRHEQLINAQKIYGAEHIKGHYVYEDKACKSCGNTWSKPTEKETDINVALALFNDARLDVLDVAYLLSSDSDQAATARILKAQFPEKRLVTVAPPGRNFSVHIEKYADGRVALNRDHLDRCVMPPIVTKQGFTPGRRPREYAPPAEWVHPKNRPR